MSAGGGVPAGMSESEAGRGRGDFTRWGRPELLDDVTQDD